VNYYCQLNDC